MNFLQVNFLILSYFCLSKSQTAPSNITSSSELYEYGRSCPKDATQELKRLVFLKFPHKVLPNSYAFIIKRNQIITLASYLALENFYMISETCIEMKSKVANPKLKIYAQRRIAHPQYADTRREYDIAIIIVDNTGFNYNFPIATEFKNFKNGTCFLLNENGSHPVNVALDLSPEPKPIYESNESGVVLCCGKLLGFSLHESASSTHRRMQIFTELHDFIRAPEFYAPYIDGLTSKGTIAIFSARCISFILLFSFIFN